MFRVDSGSRSISGRKKCGTKIIVSQLYNIINLKDIEFPMTLDQIKKFENRNNIFINVYCIEKKEELSILPIRVTDRKLDKHVNLLYVQDNNDMGHFVWIKNLSRLVSSQISRKEHKKFFCDRYVYLLKL